MYPQLDLRSAQGFHIRLQVSNTVEAAAFAATIQAYGHGNAIGSDHKESGSEQYRPRQPAWPHDVEQGKKSPFEILGVTVGSSNEEIKAAYHRVAQQYHPDKVANLAPEFQELAERRMKEINAAYHELQNQGRVV